MSADIAVAYRTRTMHFPWRYARSAGYLDWDSRPEPFRDIRHIGQIRVTGQRGCKPSHRRHAVLGIHMGPAACELAGRRKLAFTAL